jgi:Mce-associated membrane protein
MATDDQPDGEVSESQPSSSHVQPNSAEKGEVPARSATQPVRVAPLRRRSKAKPTKATAAKPVVAVPDSDEADKDSFADVADPETTETTSDDEKAEKSETTPKPETQSKPKAQDRPKAQDKPNKAGFVTVDRVDSRTALFGLGAAVLTVLLLAASIFFGVGAYRAQQREDLRAEYDAFAQQVTVNLTSLNKTNVDDIRKTLLDKTSGTAYENLSMVTQQIITQIEQHGIETQGRVLSSAVIEAEPDYGKVLMVLGWTQRIGNESSDVESQVFRWRVEMRRINGALKLTKFDWVY